MSYTKKTWANGDKVTSSALNNMEDGIDVAANPFIVTLTPTAQDFSGEMDKTVAEIYAAWQSGKTIIYRVYNEYGYTDLLVSRVGVINDQAYPSFNANMLYDEMNLLLLIYTGTTDNGTQDTYSTKIYPLTPMS